MRIQNIREFVFNKAEYIISDGTDIVTLKVDYKNKAFVIVSDDIISNTFQLELETIAQDLLNRKHAVNFARK